MNRLDRTHDLLRRHVPRRGAGLPVRLAHQRGRGPHQHLPQDDRVRARRRPRAGADERRQPRHHPGGDQPLARARRGAGPRQPVERAHVVRVRAPGRRDHPRRASPGRRGPEAVRRGFQRQLHPRRPDRRRAAAPVQHLRRGQFHRGLGRHALLPDRRVEVRQADRGPHRHLPHLARRGRQMRADLDGLHHPLQPVGGPAPRPADLPPRRAARRPPRQRGLGQPLFRHDPQGVGRQPAQGLQCAARSRLVALAGEDQLPPCVEVVSS